jgi:outer membrane protein OmpA-like peptidoglycan-associated protein
MKKFLAAATALVALPIAAQAQGLQPGGFYIGAEGGVNWMLNTSSTANVFVNGNNIGSGGVNLTNNTGWTAGGMIGYDFIGPRLEVEARFIQNTGTLSVPGAGGSGVGSTFNQVPIMANLLYDFFAGEQFTPYIGAGLGINISNLQAGGQNNSNSNVQFAYQGILGLGWNVDQNFRVNLEGRYFGSTNPNYNFIGNVGGNNVAVSGTFPNNNFSVMASLQFKFGAAAPPPPPPPPAPQATSFMVFFDWDRSNLSQQALATIGQAAAAFKQKGSARITATGHTDTSGPENYNMALSLRRANAVKDALVRNGVPATAIAVIGRGEQGLLVPTPDGVREPQNRRVEIVLN